MGRPEVGTRQRCVTADEHSGMAEAPVEVEATPDAQHELDVDVVTEDTSKLLTEEVPPTGCSGDRDLLTWRPSDLARSIMSRADIHENHMLTQSELASRLRTTIFEPFLDWV